MSRLKSSILAVLAVAVMIGFAVANAVPVEAQGSAALSISPRKNYTIEPGKSINDTLLIRNIDRERPLHLSMRVVDFTFTDDGGTPKLDLSEDAPQTTWSLKSFMNAPENITIEPGESESVAMSIAIPENQGAGSYYSAIVYSSSASEGGNVGLSASGVTLVFVTIPGDVEENLTLEKIGAYDSTERKYKFFNMEMPKRIGYTLKNEGNVAESPVGSIAMKNILFGREKTINDINPSKSLALIGQTRTFEPCISLAKESVNFDGNRQEATTCTDAGLWPGIYSVTLSGFYGQNGNNTKELIGKGYFIYTPLWFIAAVLAVLAYGSFRIWRLVQLIKRKNAKKSTLRGKK